MKRDRQQVTKKFLINYRFIFGEATSLHYALDTTYKKKL